MIISDVLEGIFGRKRSPPVMDASCRQADQHCFKRVLKGFSVFGTKGPKRGFRTKQSLSRTLTSHRARDRFALSPFVWESLNWGLSRWGLKVLVHKCPRLPTIVVILRRKFPLERGPNGPQKCTIVGECAQIEVSDLKPPIREPPLDVSK